MEIEDYCDNKGESIRINRSVSSPITTEELDWAHSRAVFTASKSASACTCVCMVYRESTTAKLFFKHQDEVQFI